MNGAHLNRSITFTLTTTNGIPPPPGALTNPGFESGAMTPWTAQPGDAVVSTPVHSGTKAVRVSPTASQTGEVNQVVTLQPNHSYTLHGWFSQGNVFADDLSIT